MFVAISLLLVIAFAMAWSAMPPQHSVAGAAAEPFRQAGRQLSDWYRIHIRQGLAEKTPDYEAASRRFLDADPQRGAELIVQYGCGACHDIPGIRAAQGTVGPDLHDFAQQSYVAGVLPNRPGDLTRWLLNPPAHSPATAMPDLGLKQDEARDIAAYLLGSEVRR
ncbi:cytochrome c2 [Hoeflea halophila]|uniref:Cytochrome c2 n=1 Tax=Hoeflea halophila TaxID=714899 RepID=A0A286ICQ9_9HYPH|nr:c-type cytochrome [Hoeflea halophila]SOE17149.1 cytochrome c2 [Hoeflea halophila]